MDACYSHLRAGAKLGGGHSGGLVAVVGVPGSGRGDLDGASAAVRATALRNAALLGSSDAVVGCLHVVVELRVKQRIIMRVSNGRHVVVGNYAFLASDKSVNAST